MDCPHDRKNIRGAIQCLRKANATDMVGNHFLSNYFEDFDFVFLSSALFKLSNLQVYKEWNGITMGLTIGIFTPIIDGSFLDEKPAVSLKRKEFKKTNILMGANKDEGMFFIFYYMADLFPKEEDVFINREDFERSITELNVYANPLQRKAIEFEYTNWLNPGDPIKNREEVRQLGSCVLVVFSDLENIAFRHLVIFEKSSRGLWFFGDSSFGVSWSWS